MTVTGQRICHKHIPSVISFAQNTRDEVRYVNGDGQIVGALAAEPGMKQTNYVMRIDNKPTTSGGSGIKCLCPHQPQTHRVYGIDGVMPSVMANTGKAGQDQAAILKQEHHNKTTQKEHQMKAEVRRLTTTEVQRLQGFDEGHLDVNDQGDSAKYSETGNSWAVNNARFVIKGIHKVDEKLTGKPRWFKYGTISSGVEAHTQASAGLGDKAVFLSEISPAPCGVLAAHYPTVPNLGDMTLVDYDPEKKCIHNRPYEGYQPPDKAAMGFEPYKTPEPVEIPAEFGEVDLVSGGTPCQDLSVAGKRKGAVEGSNTRSSLAFQLPRIGAAVRAKYIVWENVAGAFSSNGGCDFAWLIHRMTQYGYKALAWRCMDAQYIRTDKHPRGVPQRRRRVWIVGYRGSDWRVPCEALFEPIKVLGNEPPKRTVGIGFLKKVIEPKESGPRKSELEEFEAFVAGAKPGILELLEKKGICESVSARRRELEMQERKIQSSDVDDLFGLGGDLFGEPEETHQGRGLKADDLELNLPRCSDIRTIPQYELYNWAKTVSSEICYMGDLFKKTDGCEATVDDLQPRMLDNIGNAGFLCDGLVCTMKMPEWNAGVSDDELATMPSELAELYDGDVCGLSDILEPNPDPKYKLSWRACYGILNRASKRGKLLPIELGYALVDRMIEQAAYVKWCAENGRDTKKKETDLTEREIAKIAFDDFIEVECHWVDVAAEKPTKDYGPTTEEVAEEMIGGWEEESDDPESAADEDGE